jgi:hypothetical protein
MTPPHAHPEEGVNIRHLRAKEKAKTKARASEEAKAKEAPNGAKEPGEKAKARCRHLMKQPSGNGAKELKTHSGHRA